MSVIKQQIQKLRGGITKISPSLSASLLYIAKIHKIPNLKNPETYSEKSTWLKINDYAHNSLASICADKYAVRKYISDKGYPHILTKEYGVYSSFNEIDSQALPSAFVLKVTHGCGYNIICDDKSSLDFDKTRERVETWLKEPYGYASAELHYTKIKPRILIEENMKDEEGKLPLEYKIFCFNGKVGVIQVSSDDTAPLKRNYFDTDWNELDYSKPEYRDTNPMSRPSYLPELLKIASDLCQDFPLVRVDLYADENRIIFGELTLTPAAGCPPILSEYGQKTMGEMLDLSGVNRAK